MPTPTPHPLTVGVAVPDLSEYTAIDERWGIGDQRRQVEAAVTAARCEGRLPVHGRDLRLIFHSYRSNQRAEKVVTARQLAAADPLAVLGGRDFTEGALWLAAHGIPVIDVNAVPRQALAAGAPWLFTLRSAQDELFRAFVRWACREGHLRDRAIGVIHDRLTRVATQAAVDELARHGHPATAVIGANAIGVGSEQDEVAPARFERDGVDLVLGFVGGSSWIAILQAASRRGYQPAVLDLETGEHTNDVTARQIPAELYDQVPALTMSRIGDAAAGWPLPPETERALAAYATSTGEPLAPTMPVRSGAWSNTLISADLVTLLLEGLDRAGPDLNREAFVTGLEQIRQLPMASGADVTFCPEKHWGFQNLRTVRWDAGREAWVAVTDFEPIASFDHQRCREEVAS